LLQRHHLLDAGVLQTGDEGWIICHKSIACSFEGANILQKDETAKLFGFLSAFSLIFLLFLAFYEK